MAERNDPASKAVTAIPASRPADPFLQEPVAYDVFFDPLAAAFEMVPVQEDALAWPEEGEVYLREALRETFWHYRDRAAWLVGVGRLQISGINCVIVRVQPFPEGTDGPAEYLTKLIGQTLDSIDELSTVKIVARCESELPIGIAKTGACWVGLTKFERPFHRLIDLDRLNPYRPGSINFSRKDKVTTLAKRATQYVSRAVSELYEDVTRPSEDIWNTARHLLESKEGVDRAIKGVATSEGGTLLPEVGTHAEIEAIRQGFNDLATLSVESRRSALAEQGLPFLATMEADVRAAREILFHTRVFGKLDASPTLTKARKWLKSKYNAQLSDEEKQITAWTLQWLRDKHGIKSKFESVSGRIECKVDTKYRNDTGKRRFRIRGIGESNDAISSPEFLPETLKLEK